MKIKVRYPVGDVQLEGVDDLDILADLADESLLAAQPALVHHVLQGELNRLPEHFLQDAIANLVEILKKRKIKTFQIHIICVPQNARKNKFFLI